MALVASVLFVAPSSAFAGDFATQGSAIASGMLTQAQSLLGDFTPVISAVFGVAVLGLLISVVRRFL